MQLGISSYTFGWAVGVPGHPPSCPLDEQGLLDRARELKVGLLQIGDNLPLDTFDDARLERLAARARREGVRLEVGARRLTPERLQVHLAIARRLEARLLRFVIDDAGYHPSVQTVSGILRDAVSQLDGMLLGIENHDRLPSATLRDVIESAGSERIGVCLDTANSIGAGEGLAETVRLLAPLAVNLHLKDFQVTRVPHGMGFCVTGCPAGAGRVDVRWLLDELARGGRCRTAVLELWTPPEARLEETVSKERAWALQSLDFLRPYFTLSRQQPVSPDPSH